MANKRPSEAIEVFKMVFMVVVFVIGSNSDEWRNAAHGQDSISATIIPLCIPMEKPRISSGGFRRNPWITREKRVGFDRFPKSLEMTQAQVGLSSNALHFNPPNSLGEDREATSVQTRGSILQHECMRSFPSLEGDLGRMGHVQVARVTGCDVNGPILRVQVDRRSYAGEYAAGRSAQFDCQIVHGGGKVGLG